MAFPSPTNDPLHGGETTLERVTLRLRELLLSGAFPPGERIGEVQLAERLEVSRTPVRMALGILEQEGLVTGESRRGFRVRGFTLQEVIDSIAVRGQLEGMAARLVAEKDPDENLLAALDECLDLERGLLASGRFNEADTQDWSASNERFHRLIANAADNAALSAALTNNSRIPLASPGAIAFNTTLDDLGHRQLSRAHEDHVAIRHAIAGREGARAEALMREHAQLSIAHKRQTLTDLAARTAIRTLPGAELVSVPDA